MNRQSETTPEALAEAFLAFNAMSERLAESYRELEGQVARLTRELAEARRRQSEESERREQVARRLAALLEALPGGVVVLDAGGRVQEANPAARNLLGEPLAGARWNDVIRRAFAPRRDDGHEVSLVDGRRVTISTCPLADEPGQILLLTDVTEMRRLQDRLTRHQRLATMGEMAASLAHQVRTPLSAALLYGSNLKRARLDEAERARFTDKLLDQLRHLESLVNDMLSYARDGKLGEEDFAPGDLLGDLHNTLEELFERTRTRFVVQADCDPALRLHGNRQMLVSALCNLAHNAVQAMGEGGVLEVGVRAAAGDTAVDIVMRDNGPGIAEDQRDKVFNPFYTTRAEGTGLGLAVVAAIARAHNGEVWVDAPAEGQGGTTVILRLPATRSGAPGTGRRAGDTRRRQARANQGV